MIGKSAMLGVAFCLTLTACGGGSEELTAVNARAAQAEKERDQERSRANQAASNLKVAQDTGARQQAEASALLEEAESKLENARDELKDRGAQLDEREEELRERESAVKKRESAAQGPSARQQPTASRATARTSWGGRAAGHLQVQRWRPLLLGPPGSQ